MSCPPDLLITPALLSRFNVPGDFLAQFSARPFQVQIAVGGALGAMAYAWRILGQDDTQWSEPIYSTSGSSWTDTRDDVFADLAFASQTWTQGTVYTIDTAGMVTGGTGLAVSLFDLRQNACSSVTTEVLTLIRNAVRTPLLSWGDDVRTHAAAMAYAILKRGRGATPAGAGLGDENIFLAERRAIDFFVGIGEGGRPESIVDSSLSPEGPMFRAPKSRRRRGW